MRGVLAALTNVIGRARTRLTPVSAISPPSSPRWTFTSVRLVLSLTLVHAVVLRCLGAFRPSPVVDRADPDCISFGKYVKGPRFFEPPYVPADPWQSCLHKPYENWVWQSDSLQCQRLMSNLERLKLCDVSAMSAKHNSILLVGDSLTFQMFASAVLQYGSSPEAAGEAQQNNRLGRTSALICDGSINMTFIRNDYLVEGGCKYCNDFWDDARKSGVLIFNRGAHVLDNTVTASQMVEFSRRVTDMWRARGEEQIIFWRNTVPGHDNCDFFREPNKTTTWSVAEHPHGWHLIPQQNELMVKILRQFPVKFELIDAYSVTVDRADRHQGGGDCLHYCLPGPPDFWLQLFTWALDMRLSNQEKLIRSTRPTVLIYWHVPKTYGMTLTKFWKTSSRCTVFDVSAAGHFLSMLDEFNNMFASKTLKVAQNFCAILHVHAGSAPPFMRTRHIVQTLETSLQKHNGKLYELVTIREPNAHVLSYFNYVCLLQNDCGDAHNHTVDEFNTHAVPDLQAKYLMFGHVGGWRTYGMCPSHRYEPIQASCYITPSICLEIRRALAKVIVIASERWTDFLSNELSLLLSDEQTNTMVHENALGEEFGERRLNHSPLLIYPASACDLELYNDAIRSRS